MKNSYIKDILRTIQNNLKRFLAIMIITALGLTVYSGFYAACRDMYLAADRFYDTQQMFDIRVLSTLGLTDEDVMALQDIPGVEVADGSYSETVYTVVNDMRQSAEMIMLTDKGVNTPYILEGRLPKNSGEIAVTQKYLDLSGKTIGDVVVIEEELEEGDSDSTQLEKNLEEEISDDTQLEAELEGDTPDKEATSDFEVDWNAEIEIEEEIETPNFTNTHYIITGTVINPLDIANNEGSTAFRSTANTDYTFFIHSVDVNTDVYTSVYLRLEGLSERETYSIEYENDVQSVVDLIETEVKERREQSRYESIREEALIKINDAEATMNEKFTEADNEFANAWKEIKKGKKELLDGEEEFAKEEKDALQKLEDARDEIEKGKSEIQKAEAEIITGEKELVANSKKLDDGKKQLSEKRKEALDGFANAEIIMEEKQTELDASSKQLLQNVEQLKAPFGSSWPDKEWNNLVSAATGKTVKLLAADPEQAPDSSAVAADTTAEQNAFATALFPIISGSDNPDIDPESYVGNCVQAALGLGIVEGSQQVLGEQKKEFSANKENAMQEIKNSESELKKGEAELKKGRQKIENAKTEIAKSKSELSDGEKELDAEEAKALQELADAKKKLEDGKQELLDGEEKLIENEKKYLDKKQEAEEKLADAYAELDDLDKAQWYVMDRTSIDSYSGMDSDLTSINAIGKAFPILFLIVSVLISLTTMTRMVEEERGLIGTYKALGYSNIAIGFKYVLYALGACLAGSILGSLLGFVALPKILIFILGEIYIIPEVTLHFDILYSVAGFLLFTVSIVAATALTCFGELRHTPSELMRPKAPRAGSRVLLERIPFIWNHLKFLNKVTARNLFRYKKRLLMTIVGISGCTALVLTGFAIRDSVTGMMPRQYEDIYRYDLLAVAESDKNEELIEFLSSEEEIKDYISIQMESIKVFNQSEDSETVQMIVVPTESSLEQFVYTPNRDNIYSELDTKGILITKNAADLLNLNPGDPVELQNLKLDRRNAMVTDVVDNYLGNNIFISQALYESLFGEYKPNAAYAHFTDAVTDEASYTKSLLDREEVLSAVSTSELKEQFTTDFAILNYVIYILIVLAAGLAFVVLFTLSNTNISERTRELATIKVLGFFDREVYSYVNKETLILTLIGVAAGLPLGYVLSGLLLSALKMPSLQFVLVIQPESYLFAGFISFSFTLIVNLITNRILDRINMVEALKSVE